ncbi:MAG: cytochrome b, partial [bacterium]
YFLYTPHKSVGVLIFAVILARVWWRAINGFPSAVDGVPAWQRLVARAVHWVLLIGTVLMPISGMTLSIVGGHGLPMFALELIAPNLDPASGKAVAYNETLANFAHAVHGRVGDAMMIAVVLHVLGAIKHHFIDRDGTLRRMLGKPVELGE